MKNLFLSIIACCALVSAVGCTASPTVPPVVFQLNSPFDLKATQTGEFAGNKQFTIKFEKITGDNRCPQGVECITAGKASVLLTITQGGKTKSDTLAFSNSEGTSNRVVVGNYKVSIMSVLPLKEQGKEIDSKAYTIKLLVAEVPIVTPMQTTTANLGQQFVVNIGDKVALAGDPDAVLSFEAVTEDSRCPRGTNCIWAGRVDCKFSLKTGGQTYTETLAKGDFSKGGVAEAKFGPYTIRLNAVAPQREADKTQIEQKEYKAIILVQK